MRLELWALTDFNFQALLQDAANEEIKVKNNTLKIELKLMKVVELKIIEDKIIRCS